MKTAAAHNAELTGHYEFTPSPALAITTPEQAAAAAERLQEIGRRTMVTTPPDTAADGEAVAFLAERARLGWRITIEPQTYTWVGGDRDARVVTGGFTVEARRGAVSLTGEGETLEAAVADLRVAVRALVDQWQP